MILPKCPICHLDSITTVYPVARDYLTGQIFQVQKCNNCCIAYTLPAPDDLAAFYPERYRRYNPVILRILKFLYRKRAQKWSAMFRTPGVAIEMGCGDGIMLDMLRQLGWQVFGNERTLHAATYAHHELELPVFVGEIHSFGGESIADLIILFQVFEHLKDPMDTLSQLRRLIKSDGKLVIAVPNFGGWQSSFGREKWFHLDVPRHLYHFSSESIRFCLKESGFEVEQIRYASFEHDPYGWIQTIFNRIYGKHNLLTHFLMGYEQPGLTAFSQIFLAPWIGLLSLPLAITSWLLGQGAIMEIVARKSNP